MSRTASAGVIRAPRSARALTGFPSSGIASWGSSSCSGSSGSVSLLTPLGYYAPRGNTRQPKAKASWYQPAPAPMLSSVTPSLEPFESITQPPPR